MLSEIRLEREVGALFSKVVNRKLMTKAIASYFMAKHRELCDLGVKYKEKVVYTKKFLETLLKGEINYVLIKT